MSSKTNICALSATILGTFASKTVVVLAACILFPMVAPAAETGLKPPAGWLALEPLGPNLATYARPEDPKGQESSVSLQKYPSSDKLTAFRRQLHRAKMPLTLGNYTIRYVDRWNNCYRIHPEKAGKTLQQTWCFQDSTVWTVVETGPARIGDAFVSQVLRANGFRGDE